MGSTFSIDILELRWLNGQPEESDLCAHGICLYPLFWQEWRGHRDA